MIETRPKWGKPQRSPVERLLLSDRARWYVAPILVVALVLMWRGYGELVAATNPSLVVFRKSPHQFVGQPFTVSFGEVVEVSQDGFLLRRGGAAIEVLVDETDVSVGTIASVRGVVGPDLRLAGREVRVHRGRKIKWLLGGLTLLFAAGLAGRQLRLDA